LSAAVFDRLGNLILDFFLLGCTCVTSIVGAVVMISGAVKSVS
jgi:hypothetical protein